MSTIGELRGIAARFDLENFTRRMPGPGLKHAAIPNAVDAALGWANASVAGSPLAWVSGSVTAAWGLGKIAMALLAAFFVVQFGDGRDVPARLVLSGLKSIGQALAAQVPVAGSAINAVLAAQDTFDFGNAVAGS